MSFDYTTLITDRTAEDVSRLVYLARQLSAGTATAAEQAEWAQDLKGAYNASDLNRVDAALEDLAAQLRAVGYALPGFATVRTGLWTVEDIPTASKMAQYLTNVTAVRDAITALDSTPPVPESMARLTYIGANNIERILLDVEDVLGRLRLSWFYSAEISAGEV